MTIGIMKCNCSMNGNDSVSSLRDQRTTQNNVYVSDLTVITELKHLKPCFGDHELLTMKLNAHFLDKKTYWKRDWQK